MGYANFFVATYAFRGGTNLHVHTLFLNLHTGLGTKRVLKTELGTQKKLLTENIGAPGCTVGFTEKKDIIQSSIPTVGLVL